MDMKSFFSINNDQTIPLSQSSSSSSLKSVSISFEKINYFVEEASIDKRCCYQWRKDPFCSCSTYSRKEILVNVSGVFHCGMNAILGPTGCGKTTLLDILAGRKESRHLSGRVSISVDQENDKCSKSIVGYVIQNDLLCNTLTVRENLMFSVNLRLSNSMNFNERFIRVNQVIQDLDLDLCADTIIGNDLVRGISGGEKKRTCIAMEFILQPTILFLDEPTTGLDASTAFNVMNCLKNLSQQKRTIIFSIHQPRYSIYKLFDQVHFLCNGRSIYAGPPMNVFQHFSSLGYRCEEHDNPADFVLDILIDSNAMFKMNMNSSLTNLESLIDEETNEQRKHFNQLNLFPSNRCSHLKEFFYLSKRTLLNTWRNPALFMAQMISSIIYGLFTGMIFHQLERTVDPGIHNRFGAIFFIVSCQVLSSMSALETLLKERVLFIHENLSGYYRVSSFFLAKLLIDLPLTHLLPSFIYFIITFYLTGLKHSTDHFNHFFMAHLLSKLNGSSICYLIAASTSTFGVALVMVISIYVTMMLFSGFIIDLYSINITLRWIQWLSVFRYASNTLLVHEFRNLTLCLSQDLDICITKGEEILSKRHISYQNHWDLWKNHLLLLLIAIVILMMTFIQLLRIKKLK